MSVLQRTLDYCNISKNKSGKTLRKHTPCDDISSSIFDYEKTVNDAILPRILSTIQFRGYTESWKFPTASNNRIAIIQHMLTEKLESIVVDGSFDVKASDKTVYIKVDKASKFTKLRITMYNSEQLRLCLERS